MVKILPLMRETWVQSLGWEDPLGKRMATYSGILAWRIPWTDETGGLQPMGLQSIRHNLVSEQQQQQKSLKAIFPPFRQLLYFPFRPSSATLLFFFFIHESSLQVNLASHLQLSNLQVECPLLSNSVSEL